MEALAFRSDALKALLDRSTSVIARDTRKGDDCQAASIQATGTQAATRHPAIDLEQVEAAKSGDSAAFEGLVERYHRLVFKIAIGKTRDRDDAEDLCQEIFLHAFRSLPSLRDAQAFIGWLMSIAHHRGNRFCRTRARKVVILEEARQELIERANQRAVGGTQADEGVDDLVRSLPDEYRLALTWKYVEGRSYEEIGERLSMSFHQVDYVLRKAKRALRAAVETRERKFADKKQGGLL